MKVLFVTNMYPRPGSLFGIFVKEQIEEIEKISNVETDLYFINGREKGNLKYVTSIFLIPLKIIRGKYDIVHVHYGLSGLFLLFFKPKVKTFLTLHGADILEKQGKTIQVRLTKRILRKVNKVFILSKEMEEVVRPLKARYQILPCGVDIDFFKPGNIKAREESRKLIIFPGNPLVAVKNYSLFEKVIEYAKRNSSYHIETAFVHNLSREQVRDLLCSADCLLMTSFSEGSPQVVKEALSCGLPVVSVSVGDIKEMIRSVPACFASETYEVEELACLVLQTLKADRSMVRTAFIGKKLYDQHSVIKRLMENYKACNS